MERRNNQKPGWQLKLARERIGRLFEMASAESDPKRAKADVRLARKIGTRYNVKLSKLDKRRICKACNSFLVPGKNCTVRTSKKQQAVIVTCKGCGKITRFPYRREKLKKARCQP